MFPDPNEFNEDETGAAGRSMDCDAAALQAAKEIKTNKTFKVVGEDPVGGSSGDEPAGNR